MSLQNIKALLVSSLCLGKSQQIELIFTVCGRKKFTQTQFFSLCAQLTTPNRPKILDTSYKSYMVWLILIRLELLTA
jgi:hypothetical protein